MNISVALCTLSSSYNMCIMLYFSADLDQFINYCAQLYVKVFEKLVCVDDYWSNVGKLLYTA